MDDTTPLLPPIPLLHDHLTRNERERRLLRALLRLALRDREDRARPDAPGGPLVAGRRDAGRRP